MPKMKVAKADNEDLETTSEFLNACELVLESGRFSLSSAEDNWEDMDDEDEDKELIIRIRRGVAEEEGISEGDVDNRILMYEFLKKKFKKASCNWRRVYYAAEILIENVCDPTESHLAFHPSFETFHVMPEQ
jgi:hypothetical protein